MNHLEGPCVGCNDVTTNAIECNCARAVLACAACCESDVPVRCAACRQRRQRFAAYPCLDFRGDPEPGGYTGGCVAVSAVVGAWGPPSRAVV